MPLRAVRCRISAFVELAAKIRLHLPSIYATLEHRLSNGLVQSTDTKIRLLTRKAFGFHSPEALVVSPSSIVAATALPYLGGEDETKTQDPPIGSENQQIRGRELFFLT